MATVTAAFARTLARAAGYEMTATGDLLSGETTVHRIVAPKAERLPDTAYFALIDWLRDRQTDRAALVFAYARAIDMDDLGVLGLAIKTAPTLRDSLRRVERYFRLVTDTLSYRLDEGESLAVFAIEDGTAPSPAIELRNECALAGFAGNMRRFGGDGLGFERVTFRHACDDDPARYADHFGCPVTFDAGRDAIWLRPGMLDLPNRLGDRAVSDYLTAHLDAQARAIDPSITEVLMRHLSATLSAGAPSASQSARQLGLSERTLYRRLSDAGETYQGIVRKAQLALAKDLLTRRSCTIAEIAFLTGFSEQSTFSRAFKRQTGESPAQYRERAAHA